MNAGAPSIRIVTGDAGVRIEQQRPAVTTLLAGMPVRQALHQIPTLLPICGAAQSIAAERAVAAAAGQPETAEECRAREDRLWLEQGMAAAWRLAIDWPRLIGEPTDLQSLRAVQRATDKQVMAGALAYFIPGLESVDDGPALQTWVATSDCLAASVVRQAQALDASEPCAGPRPQPLQGDALRALAQAALATQPFDAQLPGEETIEVGPLAMARDPLCAALQVGLLEQRLLSQLLDTRAILAALTGDGREETRQCSWPLSEGLGMGCALTARGPVFHRVELDDKRPGKVADWRVIAPTDWHLSASGPVVQAASSGVFSVKWLRFLVAGLDPCAPWTILDEAHRDA
jgi:hypothetical protein